MSGTRKRWLRCYATGRELEWGREVYYNVSLNGMGRKNAFDRQKTPPGMNINYYMVLINMGKIKEISW